MGWRCGGRQAVRPNLSVLTSVNTNIGILNATLPIHMQRTMAAAIFILRADPPSFLIPRNLHHNTFGISTYQRIILIKVKVKGKEAYSSLQAGLRSPLRELTCNMGSHSVTCHPAETFDWFNCAQSLSFSDVLCCIFETSSCEFHNWSFIRFLSLRIEPKPKPNLVFKFVIPIYTVSHKNCLLYTSPSPRD